MNIRMFTLCFLVLCACGQKKVPLIDQTPFQKKLNDEFKDASKSPLKPKDLKDFKGLEFFPYDKTFKVKANLKRTPESEWFRMKTNTDRLSKERIYGVLTFEIEGTQYSLNVYQGEENMQTEGFEDYLFLPFLDLTNGESTYAGGRYIDLRIPEGDSIEIDFNSAYNPYCAYNELFSCPIVPRQNLINTAIIAGVKDFKKE